MTVLTGEIINTMGVFRMTGLIGEIINKIVKEERLEMLSLALEECQYIAEDANPAGYNVSGQRCVEAISRLIEGYSK